MKISEPGYQSKGDDYVDVAQYVTCDAGDEWKFITTLEVETGRIYEGDPEYADGPEACFDDVSLDPPEEVRALYLLNKRKAVKLLEKFKMNPIDQIVKLIPETQAYVSNAEIERDSAEARLEMAQAEVERLARQLLDMTQRCGEADAQLDQVARSNRELREANTRLNDELCNANDKLDNAPAPTAVLSRVAVLMKNGSVTKTLLLSINGSDEEAREAAGRVWAEQVGCEILVGTLQKKYEVKHRLVEVLK